MTQILRPREVFKRTGLSRSQIYADIAAGKFPKPIRLSARRVGFVEEEVENWILERIHARDGKHAENDRENPGMGKRPSAAAARGNQ